MTNGQKIWKYVFPTACGFGEWVMPHDAIVVHVGLDPETGRPAVWVRIWLTDGLPHTHVRARRFAMRGTGHDVRDTSKYVGSVAQGRFMWHIFEEPPLVEIVRT